MMLRLAVYKSAAGVVHCATVYWLPAIIIVATSDILLQYAEMLSHSLACA
jgi:hypothetical protein